MDGIPYTWDANGNLLNDGVNSYAYDSANRLAVLNGTTSYAYNGKGDRLQETVGGATTTFTMDLNTGLTQTLTDGTNTYLYGVGRIAQVNTTAEYFLGDALNSVRQMTDATGEITYMRAYDPYGVVTYTDGDSQTAYGYTNEYTDPNGLMYLRARHYVPGVGRFLTKDPSGAEANRYLYTGANPINRFDPTGLLSISDLSGPALFAMCFDMHSITRGANLGLVTAQLAVDVCRLAYSKDMWNPSASSPLGFNFSGIRPTNGHDLFGWFYLNMEAPNLLFKEISLLQRN